MKFHLIAIRLCIGVGLLATSVALRAQDIHFSQFYNSPFNLNPALVGQFNGAYRFIANQRTQWRSVTLPYSTFALSADARFLSLPDGVLNKKDGKPFNTDWNVGFSFLTDKAGDSQMKTNIIQLALGKEFSIGENGRIIPALMLSYTGMNIDYSNLNYDNQWNGLVYDPNLNAGESYARASRGYFHLNTGLVYNKRISNKQNITAGFGFFNLTNPKQSFFDDGFVKLDTRVTAHAQYLFPITNEWQAEPMLLWATQGTYKELNFGGRGHYLLKENKWMQRSLYFGVLGRAKDAGYILAGMKYDDWEAGISYDINTSNLKPASSGKGGFEFSVVYIIPPPPRAFPVKVCKDWM